MMKTKKIKFFVFFIVFLVTAGLIAFRSFSQGKNDWNNLSFATHRNSIKFFDHASGKIYMYSESDGKLSEICMLE